MPCQCEQHPIDRVQECKYKIALIADLLTNPVETRGINLSEDGTEGLHFLLREIEAILDSLVEAWPSSAQIKGGK
ncbi:MAG: hypothetical protein KA801_06515 [Syntrophorhabdaceae bacterium]|nr:hypothetical protein [Syntrophorhabdaceae bacterium]